MLIRDRRVYQQMESNQGKKQIMCELANMFFFALYLHTCNQRFNLLSYLELTLFGVNIDPYDINQFPKFLSFF